MIKRIGTDTLKLFYLTQQHTVISCDYDFKSYSFNKYQVFGSCLSLNNVFHILIMPCIKEHFLWSILLFNCMETFFFFVQCKLEEQRAPHLNFCCLQWDWEVLSPSEKKKADYVTSCDLGAQTYTFYVKTILQLSITHDLLLQWLGPSCFHITAGSYSCCSYNIAEVMN